MPLMNAQQYEHSLRQLRLNVYLFGERVETPVDHPMIRPSMQAVGVTYALAHRPEYADLMEDVKRELMDSVTLAREAGIADEGLILDPGIGFGKKVEHNLELINRLDQIRALGFPVLLGPSRKSFIGRALANGGVDAPPGERLHGSLAAMTACILKGAHIVRVHDVAEMAQVARVADALLNPRLAAPRAKSR